MESIGLFPFVAVCSVAFALSFSDDDKSVETLTSIRLSLSECNITTSRTGELDTINNTEVTDVQESTPDPYCLSNSTANAIAYDCSGEVYLFKEWTSSTGLIFTILLLYIGLVTITNIIVVYKFIATWNQITVSLREQNRVCAKYAHLRPTTRRQTCQEALRPCKYLCSGSNDSRNSTTACPICLLNLQNQEYVVSCDVGCGTVFHKNCLYSWLEYGGYDSNSSIDSIRDNHNSCPCCRKELIGMVVMEHTSTTTNSAGGFISDLSTLVGYYPY